MRKVCSAMREEFSATFCAPKIFLETFRQVFGKTAIVFAAANLWEMGVNSAFRDRAAAKSAVSDLSARGSRYRQRGIDIALLAQFVNGNAHPKNRERKKQQHGSQRELGPAQRGIFFGVVHRRDNLPANLRRGKDFFRNFFRGRPRDKSAMNIARRSGR